jgi:Tol biopolymer transport system component
MKTHFLLIIALFLLTGTVSAQVNKASVALTVAIYEEEVTGNLDKASELYLDILKRFPDDRPVAAKTLYHLGLVNEKMGRQKASDYFKRLVNTYPDQTEMVLLAKARLVALGLSGNMGGPGEFVSRRILTDASDVSGVLTRDGKFIRYLDRGTGDVVQFEVASGQTNRINNRGPWGSRENYIEGYVFSPDGTQIAYDRYTTEGKPQLRIRNLDCSDLRTLYDESSTIPFDWSPDNGFILALRGVTDKVFQLVLISTADGSVRVLRIIDSAPYMLTTATFSPDGKSIAFSLVNEDNPPQGEIYLITADGKDEVIVAGHPAEDKLLSWTPDGRNLLFLSDRSGTWDIWTVRINGGKQLGEPELLKKDFGRYSQYLGLAPDGLLYYRTNTPLGRLYYGALNIETGKVLVQPTPVMTRFNGAPSRSTWSPDGRSLLYVSGGRAMGNGNNNLTIRSTETEEERFLYTRLRNVWDICWAPDSRNILAWGMTVKENALFRIDTETSEITKLAYGRWAPRLCPDGKTIVFMGNSGGIIKRNIDTGEESPVVEISLEAFSDLSPDCQEAVFQEDGAVKIVSLHGGEPREIFRSSNYNMLRWTSDGRYIIAQALDTASGWFLPVSEIWRIPTQGGTPLRLDLFIPKMEFFALHPDNSRFAFSVNEGTKNELWVMENFLPK